MKDLLRDPKFNKSNKKNPTIPQDFQRKRTVSLPADTHRQLKLLAAREEMLIQDVVQEALDLYEHKLNLKDAREERKITERRNESF